MKIIFTALFLFSISGISAQVGFNNFEESNGLEIFPLELWEIGVPNKVLFDAAYSEPNALVSNLDETYPTSQSASFFVNIFEDALYYFPYIQLEWWQKTDFEEGVDGGIIETSYDGGNTWQNVIDDPVYRPEFVGQYKKDMLFNGEMGITGTGDWSWVAICWGTSHGTVPTDFTSIGIRFTLVSDENDTNQEGWMIDNLVLKDDVIGVNVLDKNEAKPLAIFPNPTKGNVFLNRSALGETSSGVLQVFNNFGVKVFSETIALNESGMHQIDLEILPAGIYFINLSTEHSIYQQKMLKIN